MVKQNVIMANVQTFSGLKSESVKHYRSPLTTVKIVLNIQK